VKFPNAMAKTRISELVAGVEVGKEATISRQNVAGRIQTRRRHNPCFDRDPAAALRRSMRNMTAALHVEHQRLRPTARVPSRPFIAVELEATITTNSLFHRLDCR
jgi:antitoxin (DNA-binding transcriptional repressor) of toxin-antitoxin stability system